MGRSADLGTLASGEPGTGVIWTLEGSEQMNANLVRFESGEGVGEHANDKVDVLFLGVAGEGYIYVGGQGHRISAGNLVFAPRDTRRSTRAASDGFAYLTVHRRRGPLEIGKRAEQESEPQKGQAPG